jgi:Carboxypeptidase regulatory-like domain/TonB dependent receptor
VSHSIHAAKRAAVVGTYLFLAACLTQCPAYAQGSSGTIRGVVTDSSGAVIAGASVDATNTSTNQVRETQTTSDGFYAVPLLPPGTYRLSVASKGFKRAEDQNVLLQVGDQLTLNFSLQVGDTGTQVSVTAEAPLVNSTNASLGQVIENRRIVELPLNGREPFSLAALAPGVIPNPPAGFVHQGGQVPSINGASNFTSEVTVDGMPNTTPRNSSANNFLIYTPTVDAVSEFKVETNALSAEYGRTNGGVISVVMKSGTNTLHGSAYEFLRNSAMDANDFFNNRQGIPLGALRRNQFGFTLGGPVILPKIYKGRDKTFFFVDYEGFRETQLAPASFTVPTLLERQGDFSRTVTANGSLIRIYDPTAVRTVNGALVRDPFPGNVIPAARISPVSRALSQYYPAPNNRQLTANLALSAGRRNINDTGDARLDHNFNEKNRLFGRYSIQYPYVGEPNFWGNAGNASNPPLTQRRHSFTLQDTHIFSPTLILNLNAGLVRMYGARTAWSDGLDITTLGFSPILRNGQQVRAIPPVTITGMSGIANGNQNYSTQLNQTVAGSLTKIAGTHTMKFGLDFRTYFINQLQNPQASGNLNFSALYTQQNPFQASSTSGFGYAAFLLGIPTGSISIQPAIASKSSYTAAYFQDDWKVTRRLTLNLGIRYDVSIPRTERYNRVSMFDLNATSPISGQVRGLGNLRGALSYASPDNRYYTDTDLNNIAPRFGFAYQAKEHTTVRGGYGIFYGLSPTDAAGPSAGFVDGFTGSTQIVTSLDGVTPIVDIANPFPNGINPAASVSKLGPATNIGQSISSVNLSQITPYFQNWNFSVQQSIGSSLLIEAAYAANKGSHMTMGSAIDLNALTAAQFALGASNSVLVSNPFFGVITDRTSSLSAAQIAAGQLIRPYPQYTTVNAINSSIGNSIYHSLQLRVEKRFSKGFTVLGSFTGGKIIDDTSEAGAGQTTGIQNPTNLRAERSIDPQDISRRLVISGVWEIPFGRGKYFGSSMPRWSDLLVGGWQINGIGSFQSGLPFVMTSIGVARPNRIREAQEVDGPVQSRLARYFDTDAYAVPAAFTFGNSSRTAPDLRGPGIANYDLSLFKNFAIVERLRAQFRFETFNAFNRVQFGLPGTQAGSTNFGVITSAQNSPRQLQLALKLLF